LSLFGGLFFQVAHLNGSLLHLSGQLPYTLLQVEDGGGHLVLFLLVGSGVFRTHIFQFLLQLFVALLQLIVFAIQGFGLRGTEIVQLVIGGVVINDELEIVLLGGPRLCVGSGPKPFSGGLYRIGVRPCVLDRVKLRQ
jgi:hypothetical protein